jgi:hypothetical protein
MARLIHREGGRFGVGFACGGRPRTTSSSFVLLRSQAETDMQLIFEQIRAGGDRNCGYLLGDRDTKQGVLIDPSYSPEAFVQRCRIKN